MGVASQSLYSRDAIVTPANAVTFSRILLSPVVVAAIYWWAPAWWVLIFGFCSMITDRIDGWLARRHGPTEFGAFLDPLADKFMVLGSFAILVVLGWVWWLPAVIIGLREVVMSLWRSHLARKGISVPARDLAKLKTWSQSFAIAFALTPGVVASHRWMLTTMLWASVVLTIVTFAMYVRDGYLRDQRVFRLRTTSASSSTSASSAT